MRYVAYPSTIRRVRRAAPVVAALWLAACHPPAGTGVLGGPREGPTRAPPSRAPLVRVEGGVPELVRALEAERASLVEAVDRSLSWFERPSSRDYFPLGEVTHERAWASVRAFRRLLSETGDVIGLARAIHEEFEFYASRGGDGRGRVLFTGYYSPTFAGSPKRSGEYQYPVYRRPDDLEVDRSTGETLGRRVGGRVVPYPTRSEIEGSGMLEGKELVWLRDPFEAYLVHIQGSAVIELPDGELFHLGYAGNNGHEYVSVARQLVDDGRLREDQLSLEEVRAYFEAHPGELSGYLRRNPRFVFFQVENGAEWPAGSLGVRVTRLRTLATDKQVYPPGGLVLVLTQAPDETGRQRRFEQLMLDQDSGGAILTPGRADIYFGVGATAELRAGSQYAEGRLYYLFLKPERVGAWRGDLDF